MPGHDHFHRHHARDQSTIVSVVYVTAPKTFEGEVGGYTTLGPIIEAPTHAPAPAPAPPATTASADIKSAPLVVDTSSHVVKPVPSTTLPVTQPQHTTLETSAVLPASIVPSSSIVPTSILLAAASSAISSSSSALLSATPSLEAVANASSTPSASSVAKESSGSGGMSTGGKVGLAVGIVCLVATVIAVVGFCFMRKRRAADRQRLDDENEKQDAFAAIARQASTRTTATAPRLSLRPVTEFLPNLAEKRQSRGNALATPPPNTAGGADANNLNNPFGNHAETIDAANASGPAVVDDVTPKGEIIAAASTGAAAGAATGLVRGASIRGQGPKAMDFTTKGPLLPPPSPSGTEFSVSSDATATPTPTGTGAAIAAAGGPANSTVHRVQLDFNPSMDDELELRAGQLIRLLHEYDDGWALCIRLDRSRQGVVPRTCLSVRPVKPRPPQNGPRGPPPPGMRLPVQARPMSPAMNQGRPMSPAMNQGRPMTPTGNRPMTPTGPQYNPQRPMTPNGQQSRPSSPSAAQMQERRNTPPGPSPMNPATSPPSNPPPEFRGPPLGPVGRKPVPGQAL